MVRFLNTFTQGYNHVILIGTIEMITNEMKTNEMKTSNSTNFIYQSISNASASTVCFDTKNSFNIRILEHAIDYLNPTTDNGASIDILFNTIDTAREKAFPVTICALPTLVSRSNILARPHAITSFIKEHQTLWKKRIISNSMQNKESIAIILMLPDPQSTWYPAGCAIARACHLYSQKQNELSGMLEGNEDGDASHLELSIANGDSWRNHVDVIYSTALNPSQVSILSHTTAAIQFAARLVDAPPSELHPDTFIYQAELVAKRVNAKIKVIQGLELKNRGFGGIYGVGKAASHAPALVLLSYVPENVKESDKSIVFVAKGITFDTGGLSLKISGNMCGMKRDMGGAAAILAAFEAVVASKTISKAPIHAILCLAENSIGPTAAKPDDIHLLYSGMTVEINNTDAEGRLVLADGVAYAVKHLAPKVLIDMATLTGAQGVTTGERIGSLYSNNAELEALAVQAGRASGDLVHPMPYAPEFFRKEFKSTVADMKNSVKNRVNCQVSCAGQFIANHLGAEYEANGRWCHVDMAYPVFTSHDERATGFGVAFIQSVVEAIERTNW